MLGQSRDVVRDVAPLLERLSSKHEALVSPLSTTETLCMVHISPARRKGTNEEQHSEVCLKQ